MMRLAALAIGYIFGIFQTGFIYGKLQGVDIRQHGSGNTGATNTLRTFGWKGGVITFAGDCLKAVFAILLVKAVFGDYFDGDVKVLELYAGMGAVLGHNFPFYLKFKGGKGIACTAGVAFAVCPAAVLLGNKCPNTVSFNCSLKAIASLNLLNVSIASAFLS